MLRYNQQKLKQIFKKYNIIFAYVFGSQASGKTGKMSDIDIAVYFSEQTSKQDRFDNKHKLMAEFSNFFKKEDIDVVALNDSYPLLSHRILKYGKLIYCKDIKKEKEYEDKAIGEYLDWEPSLREQMELLFV
ncbi:MAG: nucleotidyltransferase domain-containing protein [Patescibacteria group bacterium]|nr:nucleotidyltransferase domain-containing protein [Patescibacteria group bacterium]